MAVDTATTIGGFSTTLPGLGDPEREGAANFQHIKTVLKTTFPAFGGACTASHTEVSYMTGVTSSVQTQINAKGNKAGQVWTGTHDFTATILNGPPPTSGTHLATKTYVDSQAFASSLPGMTVSTRDKAITNDGSTARWDDLSLTAQAFYFSTL